MKKTQINGKIKHVHGLEKINITKISILPQAICRFNVTPTIIQMAFFTEVGKKILKLEWNHRVFGYQIYEAILRKNKAGGTTLSDFKPYYEAIVIKTVLRWHKNRQIDQWNRIRSAVINPCIYSQLRLDKGAKNTQWRKNGLFNK